MNLKALSTVFVFGVLVASQAFGLEVKSLAKDAKPAKADIEQLAWLVGYWQGAGLGGTSEEVIAESRSGQMPGMFRQLDADGRLMFYEFYLFSEVGDSIVLRIKHFNSELHGWEGQNEFKEFRLVEITERAVFFDGITYAIDSNNKLVSAVRVSEGDGMEPKIANFSFTKKYLRQP